VEWREHEPEQVTALLDWLAAVVNHAPWDGLAVRGDGAGELLLQLPRVGQFRVRISLLEELRPEVGEFIDALRLRRLRRAALRGSCKRRAPLLWRVLALPSRMPRGCRDCPHARYWPKTPPPGVRLRRVRGSTSSAWFR